MRNHHIKGEWKLYIHRNKVNGKIYVGITSQSPQERWGNNGIGYKPHKGTSATHFWLAIQKYGWESFEHIVMISDLLESEAQLLEQQYIIMFDSLNNGYNSTIGGCVGSKGYKHTEEQRQYMSEKQKDRVYTEEWRNNISEAQICKRPVICLETGKIYDNPKMCSEKLNIRRSSILEACRGKIHSTHGLHFQYADSTYLSIDEIEKKRKANPNKKKVVCIETGEIYDSISSCAKDNNICGSDIQKALKTYNVVNGCHYKLLGDSITLDEIKQQHDNACSNKVRCKETGEVFQSITECAKRFVTHNSTIHLVCSGKRDSFKGYHFEFIDYKPRIRKVICLETHDVFSNFSECANAYNINARKLSYEIRYGNGKIGNYTFAFYD